MNPKFEQILDECIAAIKDGEALEACLEKYPDHAEELRGLLLTVSMLKEMPMPEASLAARRESERRMLAAFHEREKAYPVSKSIFARYTQRRPVEQQPEKVRKVRGKMKNKFSYLIAGLVLTVIIATTGVGVASANALPGQALYPVKDSIQQVRLFLTFDAVEKQELEDQFQQEYLDDVRSIMEDGDEAEVEFYGVVEEIGDGYLVVDGIKVFFDENTMMTDGLEVDMLVEVEGYVMEDGSLLASSVAFEDDDFDDDDSSDDEYDDDDDSSSDEYDDDSDDDDDFDDDSDDDDDYDDDDSSSDEYDDDEYDDDSDDDDDYDDDSDDDDDYDDDSDDDDDYDDDSDDDDDYDDEEDESDS